MPSTVVDHPTEPASPVFGPSRHRLVLGVVVAILVGSNVVSNYAWPQAYIPWNLTVAAVLVIIAHRAGLSWSAIGLGTERLRRGLVLGALAVAIIAAIYLVALAVPFTREAFMDRRAAGPLATALFAALVRIPFGTVLLEEVAFRGVLPALVNRNGGWWRGALVSSVLFGLWHVLPSLGVSASNAAVGAAVGGWGTVAQVCLAVVSMFAAGMLMMLWRRWSGHVATPALAHLATNSLGVLIAWWLMSGG
ncbi:CPBP family intramembrane glutamic endopeptidase [Pseudonocardia spinosispora]|uniref:CPBP family intramembrane glutamic endopeptidase n=1 Tax=Pseudonocardia spinosispora TaxID=103441 RepID=UPI000685B9B5|nr:CPBP family intramembrane glutamic endopeptidase [Pseudonocardia spinosispora]